MSFVLEAMKKREADANPDAAVSLARQAAERHRYRLWAVLFGLAMALNAAILFWVFGWPLLTSENPAPGVAAVPAPAQRAEPATTASVAGTPVAGGPVAGTSAGPDPAAVAPPAAAEIAPEPSAAPGPRPAPRPIAVTLQNLPEDVRARFPGLAFSTHIYAEDADLRAIVANGQRLQEGDSIRGLEIVEITETGVVLAFERYRVSVPIVTEW